MTGSMSLRISTIILALLIGSIFFAGKPQPSSAQNEGFQSYQLLVFCDNSSLASATFWYEMPPGGGTVGRPLMGLKTVCAGRKCSGGPVTLNAALAQFPGNVSSAMRSKVDAHLTKLGKESGPFLACLGDDAKPEKECEKPTPWFDGASPSPRCKERQTPQIRNDKQGIVFLSICGRDVFRYNTLLLGPMDELTIEAYKSALKEHVQNQIGTSVCCDRLREAARAGSSCDPRLDLDCDGTPNSSDYSDPDDQRFPNFNTFTVAPGTRSGDINPVPPWFQPGAKGFMPDPDLCECKWEVMKATRTCSPDGRRPHVYQMRWRCPTTGNEKFTRKEEPATSPCTMEDLNSLNEVTLWWQDNLSMTDYLWTTLLR